MQKNIKLFKSISLLMALVLSLSIFICPVSSAYAWSKGSVGDKALAGVEEFKSSFDGVLTPKWFLSKFGVKLGYHLIDCVMHKKKPSVKAVVKSMMTADYVAGSVGGILGGAAGCFMVPFLSTVPIVGGLLADFVPTLAYYLGADISHNIVDEARTGKFSIKKVFKKIDWISVVSGGIGWTAGSMLGAAIFPPIGGIVGGILGDLVMGKVGNKVRQFFGKADPSPPSTENNGGAVNWGVTPSRVREFAPSNLPTAGKNAQSTEMLMLLKARYQKLYKTYVSAINNKKHDLALATSNGMKSLKLQIYRLSNR